MRIYVFFCSCFDTQQWLVTWYGRAPRLSCGHSMCHLVTLDRQPGGQV